MKKEINFLGVTMVLLIAFVVFVVKVKPPTKPTPPTKKVGQCYAFQNDALFIEKYVETSGRILNNKTIKYSRYFIGMFSKEIVKEEKEIGQADFNIIYMDHRLDVGCEKYELMRAIYNADKK